MRLQVPVRAASRAAAQRGARTMYHKRKWANKGDLAVGGPNSLQRGCLGNVAARRETDELETPPNFQAPSLVF
ncbi:MAG: hypothetical protein K2X38_20545 [Gemmataceae bacterium]|nr:hypothetical protein [Gemmataceae bacterium]